MEFFRARSLRAIVAAERNLPAFLCLWLIGMALIAASRLAGLGAEPSATNLAVHGLLILSPAIGILLGALFFPRHMIVALPQILLARVGKWQLVDPVSAQAHRNFGASGALAALSIGLLLNVVVRTGEFLVTVPAIAGQGPDWAQTLFLALGIDCILFNLLYAGAFVLAVRNVPWFPRMLLLIWLMDVLSQLLIAQTLGGQMLPGKVASALTSLLTGNMQKTLISMAIWLPYLLLSERVNITYRRRIRR